MRLIIVFFANERLSVNAKRMLPKGECVYYYQITKCEQIFDLL